MLTRKTQSSNEELIPLGDKGVPGERNDYLKIPDRIGTYKIGKYEHLYRYYSTAKMISSGKKVLDLGCGTGYGTKILYDKGNEVYGIDISPKAIDYAKKNYPGPKYICCSAEKLPFEDNFFDAVTAFEVIEHVENPEKALNEIYRVLKKEGSLFISTPNIRSLPIEIKHRIFRKPYPLHSPNIYHIKEFNYNEFINFLQKGKFKIEFQYGQSLRLCPWKIYEKIDKFLPSILCKLIVLSGYYFPKYAETVVIKAKKF